MSEGESQVFKSKIDALVVVIYGIAIVVCAYLSFVSFRNHKDVWELLFSVILLACVILPLWSINTYYVVDQGILRVHNGPLCWKIPANEIRKVEETWSILNSPALSFDRITIHYSKGKELMISPKDKEGLCLALGKSLKA